MLHDMDKVLIKKVAETKINAQNKDWFLSGAGIFIVSSIVSFLSVLLTLWWQSRIERKKKKKLNIATKLTRFSVPSSDAANNLSAEHLKISYKGIEYENLCIYSAIIKNTGLPAIEKQQVHFVFPLNVNMMEVFEEKSLASIDVVAKEICDASKKEIIHSVNRLEANDSCSISYLMDIGESEILRCEPRGVDGIEYNYGSDVEKSDIDKLFILVAVFVFSDIVPFLGSLIQGLAILASAPILIELTRKYSIRQKSKDNVLNIRGNVTVD